MFIYIFPPDADGDHNLDLNLGISPPSFGNCQKEVEGHLQFHSGPYDGHNGKRVLQIILTYISSSR